MKMSVLEKFIGLACNTEKSEETYIERISKFCETFNVSLEQIVDTWNSVKYDLVLREKFLDEWRSKLDDYRIFLKKKKGYVENSINSYLACAVSFFNKMRIPIGEIQYEYKIVRFHNKDIKPEEIQTILEHSNLRDRTFFLILKDSGLRPHTLCKLQYKHIKEDYEANRVPMQIKTPIGIIKILGNIGRANERFSFIGEEAFNSLKQYLRTRGQLNDNDYIFVQIKQRKQTSEPMKAKEFSSIFGRLVDKLKLAEKNNGKPKEIRMYCLRKFFRNNMKCDYHYVQYWMGHKLDQSDIHYISKDVERHREEYSKGYPHLRIYDQPSLAVRALEEKLTETQKRLNEVETILSTLRRIPISNDLQLVARQNKIESLREQGLTEKQILIKLLYEALQPTLGEPKLDP